MFLFLSESFYRFLQVIVYVDVVNVCLLVEATLSQQQVFSPVLARPKKEGTFSFLFFSFLFLFCFSKTIYFSPLVFDHLVVVYFKICLIDCFSAASKAVIPSGPLALLFAPTDTKNRTASSWLCCWREGGRRERNECGVLNKRKNKGEKRSNRFK